jgi:hypothetical protein
MRQKCAAIDSAVETIVQAHHEDFYESYKTFTVIVEQFAKAKEHLAALRRHLLLAQSQIRPDTARLRALYHQDLMLKDVQRLLRDAVSVSSLPERIDTLMKKKDWSQATSLLVQGCNVLARDEMVQVQGLWHLRDELANRRTKLLKILTSQVERHVYERSKIDLHPNMSVGRLAGRSVPRPARPLHRQGSDVLTAAASTPFSGGNEPLQTPLVSKHKRSATYAGPGERIFLNPAPTPHAGHVHLPSRQEGLGELHGDAENVAVAADCIAQLGGIALVLVSLRSQMSARLRKVILDTVISSSRLTSGAARPPRSAIDDENGILELRASPATGLVDAVFKQCLNTLHALVTTFEQLAATKSPAPSAGMNMLLSNDAAQLGCSVKDLLPPSEDDEGNGDWAGLESSKAWECLQIECRKFLSLVLDVSTDALNTHGQHDTFFRADSHFNSGVEHLPTLGTSQSNSSLDANTTSQSSRWWWSFGGRGLQDNITKPSNSVTFSFVVEEEARKEAPKPQSLQTLTSISQQANRNEGNEETQVKGTGMVSLAMKTSYDHELAECVARVIGWQHSTKSIVESITDTDARLVALVAAIYKPTTKFVDAAAQKVLPRSARTQGSKNAVLKPYLDDVVRSHFLPAVFLLARAWSRRILDAGDALKPRSRPRGAGWTVKSNLSSPQKAGSAPDGSLPTALPLPAAVGTASLTNRLLSLAASVPPFVTHLAGVLENVLDQVLLVFQATISTDWGGCIALMLADDVRILHILAQEKGATALGGPAAFYVKQGDTAGQAMGNAAALMDSFLSSAIAAGFGSSTKPLDRELLEAIQEASQVQKAAKAVASAGRYVQLASLAEAADHIADVVSTAASAAAFQFQRDKQEENQYNETPRRAGEAWRRRHLSHAPQSAASDLTGGLAESLVRAADRFRGLAGRCIRTLRLDLAVLTLSQLSLLEDLCRVGPSTDASVTLREIEVRLVRDFGQVVTQLDEETKYYLPPERRSYVFGSVAPFAMQTAVSLLPRFAERGVEFDARCISRICRALSSLQPGLCSVGSFMGTNVVANANSQANNETIQKRQIEKAKLYYSLLLQPPEELIAAAMAKPRRFSISEYEALLNATVVGRSVTAEHKARLRLALRQSLGDVEGSNM